MLLLLLLLVDDEDEEVICQPTINVHGMRMDDNDG
jgi:hypothetical protein